MRHQPFSRCMRALSHDKVLEALGLPNGLPTLLETGQLHAEVERAWKVLDALTARLDVVKASAPSVAQAALWFDAREAWKAAGRPRAEWWEALKLTEGLR